MTALDLQAAAERKAQKDLAQTPQKHRFDPTILREYDVRGIVGSTLFVEDAYALGRAFASMVRPRGARRLAVGYDGRLTSADLAAALVRGICDAGLDVAEIGCGPSPMLYFATHHLEVQGGIMVTGSHNPPEYNGFKMSFGKAPFFGEEIQCLGRLAAAGTFESGEGRAVGEPVFDAYVARIFQDYEAKRPLKVAWDMGNGAAGEVVQALTARLPGKHILLNETIDGTFPAHHPDPTVPANLAQLRETVLEAGCDLGIAFDGDADRIGLVDETGAILWGDQIMLLLARDVLQHQPGAPIIADVKASQVLFDGIAAAGGQPIMWKTGHSVIKAKMAELQSPLAGEMSAHIFFADRYYGYDDAVYAAVRVLNILGSGAESLSAFRLSLPKVVNTPEIRFPCAEDRKVEVVEEVRARLAATGAKVIDIDGVRVQTDDGWWLLRASNTQDVLVARCESADEAGLERLKAMVAEQLRASGLEPPAI
ncbi:MAG TPA: phosphomannomutase/phosphoglucomutase [Kiloniellaceae bacterium]|nr:phosphomannomutase/phosphoglucomutase [Kiloniellaceae bacterium]